MRARETRVLLLVAAALFCACREGSEADLSSFDLAIPPSEIGADGCNGPDHAFAPLALEVAWTSPVVAPTSRITAAQGSEKLYVTGADGIVLELDFSAGDPPLETEIVPAGFITAVVLPPGSGAAVISGLAITSDDFLVLMEHTGNVLVSARRTPPQLAVAYGTPDVAGGHLDGPLFNAKFQFDEPADLCASADGRIFVPDSGNHVIRVVESTATGIFVTTVAGTGQSKTEDGSILETAFDTPFGVKADCSNRLIITERGNFGGGNRLRSVLFGVNPFFGGPALTSETLAGDGDALTIEGIDDESSLAAPSGAVTTSAGEIYWVDRLTGVLRRYDFSTGLADCPRFADCAAAVAAAELTPGGEFSLTISDSGDLYVLDAAAQTLYRVP